MRRVLIHLVALVVTLSINGAGLVALLSLNQSVQGPAKTSSSVATEMEVKLPPPRKRPRPKRKARRRAVRSRSQPMLASLPSAIQAAGLVGPDLAEASLLDPLLEQDLGQRAVALVMSEAAVDEPPRIVQRVPPEYPWRAADRGIEGFVVLRMLVNPSGRVERLRVDEADPPGVFDEAARKAARQWRFSPGVFRGQKVSVWCRNRLVFRLGKGG